MNDLPLPLLLDGATGTQLQKRGMPSGVCTEQWVLEHPQVLQDIQRAYVEAGSDVIYAPTFGANAASLSHHGVEAGQVADYNRRLVAITREAVGERALVAGDLSPTGLFVIPFGEATFEELVDIYRQQARALAEAGVDLFAVETAMTLPEARAAVLAIREVSDKPVFVTFTCDANGKTLSGTDVLAAMIVMQGMGVSAFGLNCSTGPEGMLEQLRRLTPYAQVPLIAKPNAGLPQVVDGRTEYRCPPEEFTALVEELARAGVRIFGGCCGTTEAHIAALRAAVDRVDFSQFAPPPHDPDVIPCATEKEARFITPDVDVGKTIACSPDLMEDILDAEDEPTGALKIAILEPDDVELFAENQYAITEALCLYSDVPELLEQAVRAYHGRAFYDGTGEIDRETLDRLKERYGLVEL